MVEVTAPVHQAGPANSSNAVVPPPPPRCPRFREVSSRFISQVVSSSSSGDLHLLTAKSTISKLTEFHSKQQHQRFTSAQRWRQNQELEPLSTRSKPHTNSVKNGGIDLPPLPPCTKPRMDARKGKKVPDHQGDVHSLKMLHNHYLQCRFANAKAETSIQFQRRETEVSRLLVHTSNY